MLWGERDGLLLVNDYERDRRWVRTFMLNVDKPAEPPKIVWSRNQQDRYNDPGTSLTRLCVNRSTRVVAAEWRLYFPDWKRCFIRR